MDDYLHSWKAVRGYYDSLRGGWLSDEECDWWEDRKRERLAALAVAMPRTPLGWKKFFGLYVPETRARLDSEQVRSRVDMADLVTRYAENVRVFGDRIQARCPFHNDRSPSFSASIDKRVFYCHGCGEKGDCFSLVMRLDNCSFPEALKTLNEMYL